MPKKIVSAGHNAAVLKLRNAVIGAGYQVVHNQRSDLILDIARKGEFSAVVICSSIPAYQRKNLAKELKRIKPGLPLVMYLPTQNTLSSESWQRKSRNTAYRNRWWRQFQKLWENPKIHWQVDAEAEDLSASFGFTCVTQSDSCRL